ncbi:MAG: hypothetical protein ABH838_05495, partial [Actinomycetota bacterium]
MRGQYIFISRAEAIKCQAKAKFVAVVDVGWKGLYLGAVTKALDELAKSDGVRINETERPDRTYG